MEKRLDFEGLAGVLLSDWNMYVPAWAPGGKLIGKEWTCGSIRGGPGDSCRINTETGRWADFATGDKGGDLVSLYAATQGIKNGEAAKKLADQINYRLTNVPLRPPPTPDATDFNIGIPPEGVIVPEMVHSAHGKPSAVYAYETRDGRPIFFEARYDTVKGKVFSPWSWSTSYGRWVQKGYPAPRPLFGLPILRQLGSRPVMIVEGAKAALAARELAGTTYAVITWPNGAKAASKADWTAVRGRQVLIWPDADEPGRYAAQEIAAILAPTNKEIKILDTSGQPEAWDAADALAEGWDWDHFVEWAKPRALVFGVKNAIINVDKAVINAPAADSDKTPRNAVAIWDELGVVVTKQGQPVCNIDNAMRVLENHKRFGKKIWFDDFHQKTFSTLRGGAAREWTDGDTLELTMWMQRDLGMQRMSDTMVAHAVTIFSFQNRRNEPQEWLNSLIWDETPRVEEFFIQCFGAMDNEYTRAASRNFWIGIAARILRPGCKMDNMVVLEGMQGTYKSTALGHIGGNWFTEAHESATSKDFFIVLQGKMIVEISELHTFNKADVTRIKQVISCSSDRYRAPYERHAADHPRQSVFIGTTNEKSYLKDPTGARRFWPIRCGVIDRERILAERSQLFAEAVARFKAGEKWYEMPGSTSIEQEERRQYDEWETIVSDYLLGKSEVFIKSIATDALKLEVAKLDRVQQTRIQAVLTALKWECYTENFAGVLQRVWRKLE